MNGTRNMLACVFAIALCAFASATGATSPDKLFSVSVNQSVLAAGSTALPVTVTFTNQSPRGGNSYINSVKLQVPTGVSFTVASITTTNGNVTSQGGAAAPVAGNGGATIAINNITGVRPGGTLAVKLLINVPSASTCSANAWVGGAWAGNAFNGDAFAPYPNADSNVAATYVGCDGILACGDSFTKPASLTADDPGYALIQRSGYNKDGASTGNGCVVVPYSFANTLLIDKQTHLTWLVQPNAVFTTSVNFPLRPVDPSGWTDAKRPTLAWLTDGSGNPVFVDGQSCLGTNPPDNLPAPYGSLQAAIGTAPVNITIVPVIGGVPLPTSGSFPLVIGTERMIATFVSGTTYSVTRGDGGTAVDVHAAGAVVMSTPLPLLAGPFDAGQLAAGYAVGKQAQMCVLQYGWTSGGIDASGLAQVFDFATVIDIGDGWIGQH